MQLISGFTDTLKSDAHFWNLRQSHWYFHPANNGTLSTDRNFKPHSGAKLSGLISLSGLLSISNRTRLGITPSNRGNACSPVRPIFSSINDVNEEISRTGEAGSATNMDGFEPMPNLTSDLGRFFGNSVSWLPSKSSTRRPDKWLKTWDAIWAMSLFWRYSCLIDEQQLNELLSSWRIWLEDNSKIWNKSERSRN